MQGSQPPDPHKYLPWEQSSLAVLGDSGLLRLGAATEANFRILGLRRAGGDRLARAIRRFAECRKLSAANPARFRGLATAYAEAGRVVVEHYLMSRVLRDRPTMLSDAVAGKLQASLGGADRPSEDRNPIARNTQFEMYVFTLLVLGGCYVRVDEPDLRTTFGDEIIGIAAKRVASPRKLIVRSQEAAGQLSNQGLRGFIALNMDQQVTLPTPPADSIPAEQRGARFNAAMQPLFKVERALCANPAVIGMLVFLRCTFQMDASAKSESLNEYFVQVREFTNGDGPSDEARSFFERLFEGCRAASRLLSLALDSS